MVLGNDRRNLRHATGKMATGRSRMWISLYCLEFRFRVWGLDMLLRNVYGIVLLHDCTTFRGKSALTQDRSEDSAERSADSSLHCNLVEATTYYIIHTVRSILLLAFAVAAHTKLKRTYLPPPLIDLKPAEHLQIPITILKLAPRSVTVNNFLCCYVYIRI